jgi:hypothetical protein bfra3_13655|nr:MAG TPA: Protein of unknown function (DUF3164) [Caudoviricetes sp.]
MEEKKKTVVMSTEEAAQFAAFKAVQAKKQAEEDRKNQRDKYRLMVDSEIEGTIPALLQASQIIKSTKKGVIGRFKNVLEMKSEVMKLTKDDQKSHTFTHSDGKKRITLGVYETDGYLDTVEDGIAIVKEYIESLATDERARALVKMVLKLLSRDAQGSLKASRVVQLRKVAEESGNDRFMEGVRIIEESYNPSISKQFIRAEMKDNEGAWRSIPLGMTEA